ncbi:MJ0042-type zinc finger domain-containing protein [Bremerella sp.]|uniref:MJ0042-type zinc finger domain-containing protein n=1 Tax=Bremerella sp. TaxID=2795602 RepID=UPI0039199705
MAKLYIVCPNCSTKYPVADQKLAGRRVTCKKCSQKFVAEIQGAAPPPEDELSLIPAGGSDPFGGGDLFGDFPTSEAATSAPALGTLPPKQKSSSPTGSFAVVPVLLGIARVTGVAIVVIIAFSQLYTASGSGQRGANNNNGYSPPRGDMNRPAPRQSNPEEFGRPRPDLDRRPPFDPFGPGGRPPGMSNFGR